MELLLAVLLLFWLLSRVKIRVRHQPRDEAPPSFIAANENRRFPVRR